MPTVLMQNFTDCEIAAIATACGVTYEQAKKALNWRDLVGWMESPVFGNPWNLYRALIGLGFWKKNINCTILLNGDCVPGKTIVLVKKSFTEQHWVVWSGMTSFGSHKLLWGNSLIPVLVSSPKMQELFLTSQPNCAFQVYKANALHLLFRRIESYVRGIFHYDKPNA